MKTCMRHTLTQFRQRVGHWWAGSLDLIFSTTVLIGLLGTAVLLVTGCGGSDAEPRAEAAASAAAANGGLTESQITAVQAAIDGPTATLDASAPIDTGQIERARSALDGSTTDGTETIDANQAALDGRDELPAAF